METDVSWVAVVVPVVLTSPVMIGAGVVLRELGRRGADGRLQRNRLAGMRTKATLASDEAWRAGHVASEADSLRAGAVAIATGVLSIAVAVLLAVLGVVGPGGFIATWTTILLVGTIGVIGLAFRGVLVANRAAGAADPRRKADY